MSGGEFKSSSVVKKGSYEKKTERFSNCFGSPTSGGVTTKSLLLPEFSSSAVKFKLSTLTEGHGMVVGKDAS